MIATIRRHPERASHDRDLLNGLLETQSCGVLSSISDNGEPWAVPILHALDGDRILFHGSTGAGLLSHLVAGAPTVYTVFVLYGWVVGHTRFHSSAMYRSATVHGSLADLGGHEKEDALTAFLESIFPGRSTEVRHHSRKEFAATRICALPITSDNWLYKARSHGANEPQEETDAWAGLIPVNHTLGEPVRAPWSNAPLPDSVKRLIGGLDDQPW